MSGLGFDVQSSTSLDVMTEDVLRSSEIEGVILTSIARHLGIETVGLPFPDHYTEGVVQVMMDAVRMDSLMFSISAYSHMIFNSLLLKDR